MIKSLQKMKIIIKFNIYKFKKNHNFMTLKNG